MYSKTFNFKIKNKEALDEFRRFQIYAVYANTTPHDLLTHMIKTYLRDRYPEQELITEPELIERMADLKYVGNRSTLNGYRKYKVLQDNPEDINSRWWYTNPSGSIVYDWKKMESFLIEKTEQARKK